MTANLLPESGSVKRESRSMTLTHVVFHVLLAMEEAAKHGYAIVRHV